MTDNPGKWRVATVVSTAKTASNVMAIRFRVEGWEKNGGHMAGQHVDVRLTAPGGYMAERSYSIANAPFSPSAVALGAEPDIVELGVELLENGEVSPYLWQLVPGDQIEMRGPIGGHFIWDASMPDPLVLIAGGAGMVPLMCMMRHRMALRASGAENPDREVVFVVSLRTIDRLLYAEEVEKIRLADPRVRIVIALTESAPAGWAGYSRRIDAEMFAAELGGLKGKMPDIYVCGPTRFVEAAASILLLMGFNSHSVRTERFGG